MVGFSPKLLGLNRIWVFLVISFPQKSSGLPVYLLLVSSMC